MKNDEKIWTQKHLGVFRTRLTVREVAMDRRILKRLYRNPQLTESQLFESIGTSYSRQEFQSRLEQLAEWQQVEFFTTYRADSRRVGLTLNGKHWAFDFICTIQLHNASGTIRRPVDEVQEQAPNSDILPSEVTK